MEFGLSQEQMLLQGSVSRYLRANGSLPRTRVFVSNKEARANDVLAGLVELGIPGLLIPEDHGGVGLSLLDAALVSEVMGQHVAPVPFIGAFVLAPLALMRAGSAAQQGRWLPKIADGSLLVGVALAEQVAARAGAGVTSRNGKLQGTARFVIDYEADLYLVADRRSHLHFVEANAVGLSKQRLPTIDGTRPVGELIFDGTPAESLVASVDPAIARGLIDVGRVMYAADTLGAAQNMLDQAVAYAKQREQFDRPIATFQAVKHMCAEMAAAVEPCRALVWYAAYALDALPLEATLSACHAKAHVCEVGTKVARTATEVHGGMGFTDLVGLHYWFKRIGFNRQMLGGPEIVREEAAKAQSLIA